MAERLMTARTGRVPHHGPVIPECPVECLLTVLSMNTLLTELTRLFSQFRHQVRIGAIRSVPVTAHGDENRDLAGLVVPLRGSLVATGEPFEPFRLAGPDGEVVGAVSVFMRDLMARGSPASTQRS